MQSSEEGASVKSVRGRSANSLNLEAAFRNQAPCTQAIKFHRRCMGMRCVSFNPSVHPSSFLVPAY